MPQTENPAAASPRERILGAARQVFAARGFRAGSLNDIAVLAGYTRAGLLHHFPSKESILLALLEQRDAELAERMPWSLADLTGSQTDGEQVGIIELLRRLSAVPDVILQDRELVQLAHLLTAEASGGEHPAHDWVTSRQARLRDSLTKAIQHSISIDELAPDTDADVLAAVIYGMFEGLEAQWLLDPRVDPLAGHQAMLALLEKNVSKTPTNQ